MSGWRDYAAVLGRHLWVAPGPIDSLLAAPGIHENVIHPHLERAQDVELHRGSRYLAIDRQKFLGKLLKAHARSADTTCGAGLPPRIHSN